MGTYSVARAKHATLVASTVDDITLTDEDQAIEVINRSGSAAIYFTYNGVAPTVDGDDTLVVPAVAGASVAVRPGRPVTVVKLISSGTPTYSVGYTS